LALAPSGHNESNASNSSNGSVDLSLGRKRRLLEVVANSAGFNNNQRLSPPASEEKAEQKQRHHQQQQQQRPTTEMYANLIMQLRQSQTGSPPTASARLTAASSVVETASIGNRKEKLRCQPCFQCPVCKKRFQRHIAMNAHFQNEHIGQVQSGGGAEKVCRLCPAGSAYRSKNMAGIRSHLLSEHQIDLETPTSLLVEPDSSSVSPPIPSVKLEPSFHPLSGAGNSSTTTSSSSSCSTSNSPKVSAHPNNKHPKFRPGLFRCQSSVDIILTTDSSGAVTEPKEASSSPSSPTPSCGSFPVTEDSCHLIGIPPVTVKKEPMLASRQVEDKAKDLTVRKTTTDSVSITHRSSSSSSSSSSSGSSSPKVKRKRVEPAESPPPQTGLAQWQCQHCNIVFPNQTLYFLHRGFHSGDPADPWRCNGCGQSCKDMYDFNTHLVSDPHN
jgi:IKAROS family zinc finger protein